MATPARLSAAAAVALAVTFVLLVPRGGQFGIVALIGWVGVTVLVFGMLTGVPGSVTVAAVAMTLQLVIGHGMGMGHLPLWVETMFLVLIVEFATSSLSYRDHPSDVLVGTSRSLGVAISAGAVVQLMAMIVEGADASGVLLRAMGVAALVVIAGWLALAWRRTGMG